MPNIKIRQATIKLARECLPLFQDVRRSAIIHGVSDHPTDSTALAFAFDRIDDFERSGGTVLWPVLMSLPPQRFNIPLSFACDIRYKTTLTGVSLLLRIDGLRDLLSTLPAYRSDTRGVYKNFAIRAALRFAYAIDHEKEFRDVLIVAGTDAEDDSAAFDPSIFDSCMVPSESELFSIVPRWRYSIRTGLLTLMVQIARCSDAPPSRPNALYVQFPFC